MQQPLTLFVYPDFTQEAVQRCKTARMWAPLGGAGYAGRATWAGSQVTVVLAVAAAQIIRSPPAPVSVAVGPEFVLGMGRQDLDAAASGQDGHGNQDEGCQPCVNLRNSLLHPLSLPL